MPKKPSGNQLRKQISRKRGKQPYPKPIFSNELPKQSSLLERPESQQHQNYIDTGARPGKMPLSTKKCSTQTPHK